MEFSLLPNPAENKNYSPILVKSTGIGLHFPIDLAHQTEFCSFPNPAENCKYNPNQGRIKIILQFLLNRPESDYIFR